MRDLEQVINEGNAIIEAKDNQIERLRDQNTDYLNKITSDHKELIRLRNTLNLNDIIISNLENEVKEICESYKQVKAISKVLFAIYFITVVILMTLISTL